MKLERFLCVIGLVLSASLADAALTTNSWTNSVSSFWDVTSNWSLGVAPSNNQAAVLITNAATKTVTIDSFATGKPGVMTISNLTVRGFGAGINTLFLNNAGTNTPLRILNNFTLGTNAVLRVANSVLRVDGVSGGAFSIAGNVTNLANGQIIVTNSSTIIASNSVGQVTQLGGTMLLRDVRMALNPGSQGTFTMSGGTNSLTGGLLIAFSANSTGIVSVTSGLLQTTGDISIGFFGVSRMTVAGGALRASSVLVGDHAGAQGTWTISGGSNTMNSMIIGDSSGSTGAVWMTGGDLFITNGAVFVGNTGVGTLTISNGTWRAAGGVLVGNLAGALGTLTIAGGTHSISPPLFIGRFDCAATGNVIIAGGQLFVTNAAHNAVLEMRSGTFTLSSGTVTVDQFVMTNFCAHFVRTGGTLIYSNAVLNTGLSDDDGDGLPNAWEQSHGLDPLDPLGANGTDGDPDGDGFSNLQEYFAGTDPTNSASAFRILSVAREGNNMRVTWSCVSNQVYVVQTNSPPVSGSYTNNFGDLSPSIQIPGSGVTRTNYLDIGGATNKPTRYYRVILLTN